MKRFTMVIGLVSLLCLMAGCFACTDDEQHPASDLETTPDASSDSDASGDVDTSDDGGGNDSGPDGDSDVNDDDGPAQWGGWEECDCPNPDEMCSPSFCGLPDAACGPDVDQECPDGYTCQEGEPLSDAYICVCAGSSEHCTPECDSNYDCPQSNQRCSFADGVCRWSHSTTNCVSTTDCPEGFICDSEHSQCEPTGDLATGDSCDEGLECTTGICHDGYCDEQCTTDADCEDGESCSELGDVFQSDGCKAPSSSSECTVSCPSDKRCVGDECRGAFCRTTGDCDSGDCVQQEDLNVRWSIPARCVETEDPNLDSYCKPEELYVGDVDYCYLPGACWDDSHCDAPYTCDSGRCLRHADEE